jgi:hypothetical protein
MSQTKASEIQYLKSCLASNLEDEDEKRNIVAFISALESGLLDQHEGRLAVFYNGEILDATFESASSFQSFKPPADNNSYTLYTIPGGQCEVMTAYQTAIQIQPNLSSGFNRTQVPLQFRKMVNKLVTDMTLKLIQVLRILHVPSSSPRKVIKK